jgi:hypothetical protein
MISIRFPRNADLKAGEVLGRVAGACDDAAANIAAAILRKRSNPEDDENRGGSRSK